MLVVLMVFIVVVSIIGLLLLKEIIKTNKIIDETARHEDSQDTNDRFKEIEDRLNSKIAYLESKLLEKSKDKYSSKTNRIPERKSELLSILENNYIKNKEMFDMIGRKVRKKYNVSDPDEIDDEGFYTYRWRYYIDNFTSEIVKYGRDERKVKLKTKEVKEEVIKSFIGKIFLNLENSNYIFNLYYKNRDKIIDRILKSHRSGE